MIAYYNTISYIILCRNTILDGTMRVETKQMLRTENETDKFILHDTV